MKKPIFEKKPITVKRKKIGAVALFDGIKPGDSFYIEGSSTTRLAQAFGQYLMRGKYAVRKEGKGLRFSYLKDDNGG